MEFENVIGVAPCHSPAVEEPPADVVSDATLSIGLQNAGGAIRIACEGELTRSSSARGVVPLTCREFADFMMDYLSDELSTESRATFEYHLNVCTNCQRYLASYRETIKLGKRAFEDPDADLPSQVPEELVKAILAARPKQ